MHDEGMLAVSDLYDDLENFAFCPAGRELCLYGDAAYPLRIHSSRFPSRSFNKANGNVVKK